MSLSCTCSAHGVTHSIRVSEEDRKTVPTAANVAYGIVSRDQRPSGEEGSPMYELVNQSSQPSATPTAASEVTPSTTQQQSYGTEEPVYDVITDK